MNPAASSRRLPAAHASRPGTAGRAPRSPALPLLAGLTALTWLSLDAGGASGYLPITGPTPLRFRLSLPENAPGPELPPLSMTNNYPVPTLAEPPEEPPPAARSETSGAAPPSPAGTNLVHATSESGVLIPQSILKYFQLATTNGIPHALVPIGFTPALPAQSPSSTATYRVSP